jgi:hypothetical protein
LSWASNRKMRQIHVIEGQYIRSNCHYELSWTHLYVKFPSSRRSPQFKASTVPHWCLPSRGGARRVSSGSRADWEMEVRLKQLRYSNHMLPGSNTCRVEKDLLRLNETQEATTKAQAQRPRGRKTLPPTPLQLLQTKKRPAPHSLTLDLSTG